MEDKEEGLIFLGSNPINQLVVSLCKLFLLPQIIIASIYIINFIKLSIF